MTNTKTQKEIREKVLDIVERVADYGANEIWEKLEGKRYCREEISPLKALDMIMSLLSSHAEHLAKQKYE